MIATVIAATIAGLFLAFSHTALPRLFGHWHPTVNYAIGCATIGVCLTGKALITGSLAVEDYWIVLAGAGLGTVVLGYWLDVAAEKLFDLRQAWRAWKAAPK